MTAFDLRADADLTGGFRTDETMPGGDHRYLNVLFVDGAVTSVTANGETGAALVLADGRRVTIAFARDAVGGTIAIDGATTPLAAGIDTLPE
jgi:prepilin-type processing-associated H-X9-DG protein